MSIDTLASWHRLIEEPNADRLDSLLSEKVVFHSPILHTPQAGKALTKQYLVAALGILLNDSFRYVREVSNSRDAVLEFRVEVATLRGASGLRYPTANPITVSPLGISWHLMALQD